MGVTPIDLLRKREVKILSKLESLPESEPILRDLAAGRVHADYPVKGQWYVTNKGVRFKLVGDWQWIRDFAGVGEEGDWFSGEVELRDGSRCIAEVNLTTCKAVGWWQRVFG